MLSKAVIEALTLVSKHLYGLGHAHMYLYRATVYMCVGSGGTCINAGAQGRAERAPGREVPALALASAVNGHDGRSHHGQRGRDECGGEGSGEGSRPRPSALTLSATRSGSGTPHAASADAAAAAGRAVAAAPADCTSTQCARDSQSTCMTGETRARARVRAGAARVRE